VHIWSRQLTYFLDDDVAGGLGQVLDHLDDQRFGKIWLTAISFGFLAYAIYMLMAAVYRKFPDEATIRRPSPYS
jgi:hypothetical protein